MKSFWQVIIIAALLLAGCGVNASADSNIPFAYVTIAPNPSATPTPFQPVPWTPTDTLLSLPVIDSEPAYQYGCTTTNN